MLLYHEIYVVCTNAYLISSRDTHHLTTNTSQWPRANSSYCVGRGALRGRTCIFLWYVGYCLVVASLISVLVTPISLLYDHYHKLKSMIVVAPFKGRGVGGSAGFIWETCFRYSSCSVDQTFIGVVDHNHPRSRHAYMWSNFGTILPNHLKQAQNQIIGALLPAISLMNLYTNLYPDWRKNDWGHDITPTMNKIFHISVRDWWKIVFTQKPKAFTFFNFFHMKFARQFFLSIMALVSRFQYILSYRSQRICRLGLPCIYIDIWPIYELKSTKFRAYVHIWAYSFSFWLTSQSFNVQSG